MSQLVKTNSSNKSSSVGKSLLIGAFILWNLIILASIHNLNVRAMTAEKRAKILTAQSQYLKAEINLDRALDNDKPKAEVEKYQADRDEAFKKLNSLTY
jgi:hypothetical protein